MLIGVERRKERHLQKLGPADYRDALRGACPLGRSVTEQQTADGSGWVFRGKRRPQHT